MVNAREKVRTTYRWDLLMSGSRGSDSDPVSLAGDLPFLGGSAGSLGFLLVPFLEPLFFLSPLSCPSLFLVDILSPDKNFNTLEKMMKSDVDLRVRKFRDRSVGRALAGLFI